MEIGWERIIPERKMLGKLEREGQGRESRRKGEEMRGGEGRGGEAKGNVKTCMITKVPSPKPRRRTHLNPPTFLRGEGRSFRGKTTGSMPDYFLGGYGNRGTGPQTDAFG